MAKKKPISSPQLSLFELPAPALHSSPKPAVYHGIDISDTDRTLWEVMFKWKPAEGDLIVVNEPYLDDTDKERHHYSYGFKGQVISTSGNMVLFQLTTDWYRTAKSAMWNLQEAMGKQFYVEYNRCAPLHYNFPKPAPEDGMVQEWITPAEGYTFLPSVNCYISEDGDVYPCYEGQIDRRNGTFADAIAEHHWFASLNYDTDLPIVKPHILFFNPDLRDDMDTEGEVFNFWYLLSHIRKEGDKHILSLYSAMSDVPIREYTYDNEQEAQDDIASCIHKHRHSIEAYTTRYGKEPIFVTTNSEAA